MSCQKAFRLDEESAESRKLRTVLFNEISKREGSALWQIQDLSTQDLLVMEVASRTHLTEDQIRHVPVAKLRNVFERTASIRDEKVMGHITSREMIAPVLCGAFAAAGYWGVGSKAIAVVFGLFAVIGGLNIGGAVKEAREAREKNRAEGKNLLATAARQAAACTSGPCGSCHL